MQGWEHGIEAHELYERYRKLGLPVHPCVENRVHPKPPYEKLVAEFLRKATSFPLHRFPLDSFQQLPRHLSLQRDLKLAGEEGLRVVQDFADEFEVKLDAFRADLHFPELTPVSLLMRMSRALGLVQAPKGMPITICDLVCAAREHKWPNISAMEHFARGAEDSS